ncbi:MAG: hypothetical protein HY292_27910, partial [Planctomycetes bacterium]|nr:hypothetical protein [Planctomycetota bacterium]
MAKPTKSKSAQTSSLNPPTNLSQSIRDYLSQNPNSMPKDVVAALKAKGVLVAPGLVGLIKHSMKRGARNSAGKAIKRATVAAKAVGRPKAGGVNRSQAIRDYMKQNPGAKPKQI